MNNKLMELLKNDRFAAYIGIELVKVEPGYAMVKMEISEKHLNGANIIQGGAIFTLADFAFAAASNACGHVTVGINANISYFQASTGKTLIAEAKLKGVRFKFKLICPCFRFSKNVQLCS